MNGGRWPGVRLPRSIAEAIVAHARAERPSEACGVVIGSARPADHGLARRYVPCRNAAASPSRFLVDRDDLLAVLAELDRSGEELWGVVHSHVRTAAVPSATDVAEAAWPTAVYLVVSLAEAVDGARLDDDAGLRAWRIADGGASELTLAIGEGAPDDGWLPGGEGNAADGNAADGRLDGGRLPAGGRPGGEGTPDGGRPAR